MAASGTIVFTSPGVLTDAGGIQIFVGSDGKIHVKRVPGWNPEVLSDVTAAVSLIAQAGRVKNAGLKQRLEQLGNEMLQAHAKDIQHYVEAPQAAAAGG